MQTLTTDNWFCSLFISLFEDSLLQQGERPYWSIGLKVGPGFFCILAPLVGLDIITAVALNIGIT